MSRPYLAVGAVIFLEEAECTDGAEDDLCDFVGGEVDLVEESVVEFSFEAD